jgi:hypothetical protein
VAAIDADVTGAAPTGDDAEVVAGDDDIAAIAGEDAAVLDGAEVVGAPAAAGVPPPDPWFRTTAALMTIRTRSPNNSSRLRQ